MSLPTLLGGAPTVRPPADVVQSCVALMVWRDMSPCEPASSSRMTRDEFASLVTHELRNPLNAMTGWLHLLSAEPAPRAQAAQRALGGLRRALDQQLAQIDTLGRVMRMLGGERVDRTEPVELGGLLSASAEALRSVADAAGRTVRVEIAERAVWIAGDRGALLSTLTSFGAYGLRHGLPGAPLVLGLDGSAHEPVLRVEIDEGDEGGLSVWNAFGSGGRLALDLLHALLTAEAHGARVSTSGEGRVGDVLLIRFEHGATAPDGHESMPTARPHA